MNNNFLSLILTVFLLTGCGTMSNLFGDVDEPPLPGDRISFLQLEEELEPDPLLETSRMVLPSAWDNKFWPQTGGYPNHAMGHLKLSPTIEEVWDTSIGAGGSRRRPLLSQPVVAGGVVYTLDSKALLSAFDVEKGKRQWKKSLVPKGKKKGSAISGGIAYSQGRLFATSGFRSLVAVDPLTGDILWQQGTTTPTRSSPAVIGGRVFVMTLDNRLIAYNVEDGAFLWEYKGEVETTNLLGAASPAANKNVVVVAFSSGELFALRAENGQRLWSDSLASIRRIGANAGISDIQGLPVIDKGIVYAISFSGRMVAIDERTGNRLWQREIGGTQTPWAAGSSVFVLTSSQQLVALNRQNGQIRWVSKLPKSNDGESVVWTGPVFAGGRLIVTNNQGDVVDISPEDGVIVQKWETPGSVVVPPLVADGTLYLLNDSGKLTAYR